MCRVFRVNRSTYYKWLHRSPSVRELENSSVRTAILVFYHSLLLTLTVFTIPSDLIHTITVFLLTKRRRCLCLFDSFAVCFIDISHFS